MTYKMQWLNVSVKDTFEQISTRDKQVKTKDCLIKGDYPVVDQGRSLINGFVNDETKVINLNKKPIVIFGDHTRIIKWINFNFVPGADGTKLLMPKEFLIPRFFYYQLKSIDIKDRGYGRHFKILQESNFKVAPLAEQQEIVRQLDVMLAQVEQIKARLDAIPTILKKFRQSVLADAVSGKLTEEWREQNNLPLANIEKLERVVDSSFYGPRFSKDDYTDDLQNGIPTIRTTDMSDGKIIVTPTTPRIIVPPEKIEQFKVKPSDLLITRTGSIGVMALVREEYLAIPSAYLIRFRFKQNLVSSDYIYYALTSPNGQNQMGLSTTAITQPNINANSIRALEIYLPSIEEQKEIVKRVDTLFGYAARIEETIQSAQKRLNLLTQSILAKAFSGELTAEWREQHQDLITGVNSAEALLAKI